MKESDQLGWAATIFAIITVIVLLLAMSGGTLCVGTTCIIMPPKLAMPLLITLVTITGALILLADHYKHKGK